MRLHRDEAPGDDNAETMRALLQAYHDQTAPLIAFYEARGALDRVPAMGDIDEIARTLSGIAFAHQ